jgi:hypothetical protein
MVFHGDPEQPLHEKITPWLQHFVELNKDFNVSFFKEEEGDNE